MIHVVYVFLSHRITQKWSNDTDQTTPFEKNHIALTYGRMKSRNKKYVKFNKSTCVVNFAKWFHYIHAHPIYDVLQQYNLCLLRCNLHVANIV